jgi:HTH-type transcriptional regulator / antitoxin HigA
MSKENQYIPESVSYPGTTLVEKLDEIGMTQKEFAERTGKPEKTISKIINGTSAITPETAVLFERVLKIPARFWLQRESHYQEYLAKLEALKEMKESIDWVKNFPILDMIKLGWIEKRDIDIEQVPQLLSYFGVAKRQQWENIYIAQKVEVAFRMSLAHTNNPYAISAWLRQGDILSNRLSASAFDKAKFKIVLHQIKELACLQPSDYKTRLVELCATSGVKVVFVPNISKATINGAMRWVGNNPVIQLSGRYKTNNHFWFDFFHEAGHVLLHEKKEVFLENVEGTEVDQQKEDEANEFAQKTLIAPAAMKELLQLPKITSTIINHYSKICHIHPGVLVGLLQHNKKIEYSFLNDLKAPINILND